MQNTILNFFLILLLGQSLHAADTSCSKNPGLTQKKMTHIMRSLACANAKSMAECESALGLTPSATAMAAGSAIMGGSVASLRPDNLVSCAIAQHYNSPWSLFRIPFAEAAGVKCSTASANTTLNNSTNTALSDVRASIESQRAEIAKQKESIRLISEAEEKSKVASDAHKAVLKEYYKMSPEFTAAGELEERLKKEKLALKKALEAEPQGTSKYWKLESQLKEITTQHLEAYNNLDKIRMRTRPSPELATRLNETKNAANSASVAARNAKQAYPSATVESLNEVLKQQEARLAEYLRAEATYAKAITPGARSILAPVSEVRAASNAIWDAGAINSRHAANLKHVDYLLDMAERAEMGSVQNALAGASRASAAKAAAAATARRLGVAGLGRVGFRVLGGVVAAAGAPVVFAGQAAIELGFFGAPPSDQHCLDQNAYERNAVKSLISFTQGNECKSTPVIANMKAFRDLFELPEDQQMTLFKNSEFCNWLENVYDAHSPKVKATCNTNGATYSNEYGKNIQFTVNSDGNISRMNSYGTGREISDLMYSVNFKDGEPDTIGVFPTDRQLSIDKTFSAVAFLSGSQLKNPYVTTDTTKIYGTNKTQLNEMRLNQRMQNLTIAEVKSCCNPTDPKVDDATCYTRYGIKAKVMGSGSSSDSNSGAGAGKTL